VLIGTSGGESAERILSIEIIVHKNGLLNMDLNDLINRKGAPTPWEEGDNIPWNEPGFSRRMLNVHLSQANDAASRRFEIIDRQVGWVHTSLLKSKVSSILDLGCGPGLYSTRLARLGHTCYGIDYSPASIEYAAATAHREQLNCDYLCQDIRQAEYPPDKDLVMLIFGEFNVFRPVDIAKILDKSFEALKPGGILLMEPHTFRMVKKLGRQTASWYSSPGGLFFDASHVVLQENIWDENTHTATIRYFVLQTGTGLITRYAQTFQAYLDGEYRDLLIKHGYENIEFRAGLSEDDLQKGLMAIVAAKKLPSV
jgi:2-polyprenyl-3-methyl-5-hydroxy-6-metoxy-1,4-benzoquinol methylase